MMVCVMQLACNQLQYWLGYQRCGVCDFWRPNFTNKLTRHTLITKLFCECGQERVNIGKNREEVVFEVPYDPLGFVSMVHVWRNKLELGFPQLSDDSLLHWPCYLWYWDQQKACTQPSVPWWYWKQKCGAYLLLSEKLVVEWGSCPCDKQIG